MPETRNIRIVTLFTALPLLILGLFFSITAHPGSGIAVDRHGQIYFLDTGSGRWKIDTRGGLTHLSGVLSHWLAIDENSRFAGTRLPTGSLGEISKVGIRPITTLVQTQSPWSPTAVALFGSDVYVLEFLHTVRDVRRDWLPRVRKITSDGSSTIIMSVDRMPGAR